MDDDEQSSVYQFETWNSEEIPLVTLGSNGDAPVIEIDGLPAPSTGPYFVENDDGSASSAAPNFPATTTLISIFSPNVVISSSAFLSSPQSDLPATSNLPSETTDSAVPHVTGTVRTEGQSPSQSIDPVSTDSVGTTHQPSDSLQDPSSESTILPTTSNSFLTSAVLSSSLTSAIISTTLSPSILSSSFQTVAVPTSSALLFSSSAVYPLSSSSSSIPISSSTQSTSNRQSATPTVVPPPIVGKESNLNVHGAPFYVGVIFAVIAGIALLAALIAWLIRLRSHARRREAAITLVPWAGSGKDHGGRLEAGQGSAMLDDSDLIFANREDLAHVQAWTPRGDRDVGEPKHADCYFGVSGESGRMSSPNRYLPPALCPGARRQLPPHLVDANAAAQAMQEVSSYHPDRRPSFANVGPPDSALPLSQYMIERLRDHRKRCPEPLWEVLGPLPTPGGPERQDEVSIEAWSASIKAGLANAFNAVAANLSGAPRMPEDDNLTEFPKRAARRSIRDTFGRERTSGGRLVSRDESTSTVKSKAWTLEETGNGAGIVHILLKNDPPLPRPSMPSPTLSFGDGERIFTHIDGPPDNALLETRGHRIPLVSSSKPQAVHIPPPALLSRQMSTDTIAQSNISRKTTRLYSQTSLQAERPTTCSISRPCISRRTDVYRFESTKSRKLRSDDDEDSIVIRPDTISRPLVHK